MNDEIYFKFIDAVLAVDGEINTRNLTEVFGIGRQKASQLFSVYTLNTANMTYEPAGAGSKYKVTDRFKPYKLGRQDAEEYLNCIDVVFRK